MKIYVPFNAQDLVVGAKLLSEKAGGSYCVHSYLGKPLATLTQNDTLYIIAHGRRSRGDQICGETRKNSYSYLSAAQLAKQLRKDGLPKNVGDVRLMVCWSGYVGGATPWKEGAATHTLQRTAGEAPFAGQLCAALKNSGYNRMIVTGFTGEVTFPKANGIVVPNGVWLTDKDDNLVITQDNGARTLSQLLALCDGTTGSLSNSNRTVWY
jgi:hypothetical protein